MSILYEGAVEDAGIALLKSLISGTEFEGKVYIAGGFVRDELMGKQSKDIDLVIDLPNGGIKFAEFVARELGIYSEGSNPVIYPRFGTAKLHFHGVSHNGVDLSTLDVECVAPRTEKYDDRTSRKPDVASGSLQQDVERRDFTANSLLKNLTTDEIEDLTGLGVEDLRAGMLRTPLDPDVIFDDDPLRMLRAIRFAVKYGWQFAPGLEDAIRKNADRLAIISKERVRDELQKMLVSDDPRRAIDLMLDTGLMKHVHPKLAEALMNMRGMEQNAHHHLDVYDHVMEVVANAGPGVAERLSALLHDIAKPQTRTPHESKPGEYRFLGHEDEGADLAREIMQDLKFPNEVIDAVVTAVSTHMGMKDPHGASPKAIRKWARKVGDHLDLALDLLRADAMGHNPEHRDHDDPGGAGALRQRISDVGADEPENTRQKIVNGHDLMQVFGLKPGPDFRRYLDFAQDVVDEQPDISRDMMLDLISQEFNLTRLDQK